MGRYTTSWLILLLLGLMWLAYFFGEAIRNAPDYTAQQVEEDLGAGAWCVSVAPGQWDCIYPVFHWRCSQAGGYRAHCVPEGM